MAQTCKNFGESTMLTATTHRGEFPFAATVIRSNQTLIVVDIYNGHYSTYALTSGGVTYRRTFVSPVGNATTSGVAWVPDVNPADPGQLYWVVAVGGEQLVVRTDLRGAPTDPVSAWPVLESPLGGFVGDIEFDTVSMAFWAHDLDNRLLFEFRISFHQVEYTGRSFLHPGIHPDCERPLTEPSPCAWGGAYGAGFTFIEQQVDLEREEFIDILSGDLAEGKATRVIRMRLLPSEPYAEETGWTYPLSAAGAVGFPQGMATYVEPNGCAHHLVVMDTDPRAGVNAPEIRRYSAPVRATTMRTVNGGVVDLTCVATPANKTITLAWANRDFYDRIEIYRDDVTPAKLIDSLPIANNTPPESEPREYTVTGVDQNGVYVIYVRAILEGNFPLPAARCVAVVGPGSIVGRTRHRGLDALAITVDETRDLVHVADLVSGEAYSYTKSLDVPEPGVAPESVDSPFGAGAMTVGIAYNGDRDTLLWLRSDAADGVLVETDPAGANPSGPIPLGSPGLDGIFGDIAYDTVAQSYWGCDIRNEIIFEFEVDVAQGTATLTGRSIIAPFGPDGYGNGIATLQLGPLTALDIPGGSYGDGFVNRVVRYLTTGVQQGEGFDPIAATNSGFVNGTAWTGSGSVGGQAEYLVANDTNMIYEISLQPGFPAKFRRGDCNADGIGPNMMDAYFLLDFIFGSGASPPCFDACDTDDQPAAGGKLVEMIDAVYLLRYLFVEGPLPPDPGPTECGPDPTGNDIASCDEFLPCE